MTVVINTDGTVVMLNSREAVELSEALSGELPKARRASNVEQDADGFWRVTLSDDELNGQHKGYTLPDRFRVREDAIEAEIKFLEQEVLA
jgi:hypothetical protein